MKLCQYYAFETAPVSILQQLQKKRKPYGDELGSYMVRGTLSTTSALVLLWTDRSLYKASVVKAYWDMLDLSSGTPLYNKCNAVWPRYNAVINDRKWIISTWCKELLTFGQIKQVIIFAAGWAPLGLELANDHQDCDVFEVDIANMEEKSRLVSKIHSAPKNIRFITADITDRVDCQCALEKEGWRADAPSLLVFEGISYYIGRSALMDLIRLASNQSHAIVEYMTPYEQVEPKRRAIPEKVFGIIGDECKLQSPMRTWDFDEIRAQAPGTLVRRVTLCDIEKMRKIQGFEDSNDFPEPNSGWIEVVDILI